MIQVVSGTPGKMPDGGVELGIDVCVRVGEGVIVGVRLGN